MNIPNFIDQYSNEKSCSLKLKTIYYIINKIKITLLLVIILTIILNCKKDSIETDPSKAILGKWILIEMKGIGIEKIKQDGSYGEYLKNGTYIYYDNRDKKKKYMNYYIKDSILNIRVCVGENGEEIWERSLFKFSNKNNILTTDISPWEDAQFNVFIYKRKTF